jgi:hypothetical protein
MLRNQRRNIGKGLWWGGGMGFDSIYQDWKEKGLFVKRLRIQPRKINPIRKALLRMAGYGYYSPALALVIMCGVCWVVCPPP